MFKMKVMYNKFVGSLKAEHDEFRPKTSISQYNRIRPGYALDLRPRTSPYDDSNRRSDSNA